MSNFMLSSLPTEVLDPILEDVFASDLPAFYALRCVCRDWCIASNYVFYRHISLHNAFSENAQFNTRRRHFRDITFWQQPLVERGDAGTERVIALIAQPSIADCVRRLSIGPFHDGRRIVDDDTLLKLVSRLKNLQDLHWNTFDPIPSPLLASLESRRPACRLHISHLTYYDPRIHSEMLSYSGLNSLDIGLFAVQPRAYPKYTPLRHILPPQARLERLSLLGMYRKYEFRTRAITHDFEDDFTVGRAFRQHHEDFSMRSSWVEKSSIRQILFVDGAYHNYNPKFTIEPWISQMDWSRLRYLDLEAHFSQHLLLALTGQVPQLGTLKLGDIFAHRQGDDRVFGPLRNLLQSIDGLREVSYQGFTGLLAVELLYTILRVHGSTLDRLTLDPMQTGHAWNFRSLGRLSTMAFRLRELAVQVPAWRLSGSARHVPNWHDTRWRRPRHYSNLPNRSDTPALGTCQNFNTMAEVLATFRHLERLHLGVAISNRLTSQESDDWTTKISEGSKEIDEELREERVDAVVQDLFDAAAKTRSSLNYIEIVFFHDGPNDRNWRVQARRIFSPLPGQRHFTMKVIRTGTGEPGKEEGRWRAINNGWAWSTNREDCVPVSDVITGTRFL